MLNRIFWFTTGATLAAIWWLCRHVPAWDAWLRQIDFAVAFGDEKSLPVPGGYLLPALGVGILTRIYRLHAHISDWLGIRECFDVDVVITEFADQLAIDLSHVEHNELVAQRHAVMKNAFYPFVSGPQPQIDPQLIQQALDAWSWFWIGIEATCIFLITGLALVAGSSFIAGAQTIGGTIIVAAIALPAMRSQCQRYAIAQVRAIVADPARAAAARNAFAGIASEPPTVRMAA
jgi:hypothetical protein